VFCIFSPDVFSHLLYVVPVDFIAQKNMSLVIKTICYLSNALVCIWNSETAICDLLNCWLEIYEVICLWKDAPASSWYPSCFVCLGSGERPECCHWLWTDETQCLCDNRM